jgi:hypothetical protein
MGSPGYYSVIQFCPDPSRLEAANVGVVLFCPEQKFLKAMTSSGNDRIRRFFGDQGFNWSHVNAAKQALVTRLEIEAAQFAKIEDLLHFVRTRGNAIVLSEPRSMRVEDPEADLKELFDELVGT